MLTTKNWGAPPLSLALVALVALLLSGCTPAGPRALLEGERHLQAGEYPQAIAKFQLATQLLPASPQAWNHLALAYHKSGQANEALRAYQQALRHDPNLAVVRYNLGCLFLEQNQAQWAVSELTTFTILQTDSAEGWLKLATAQLRTQQLDPAERSFQNALRLEPGLVEAWNGLGLIHTHRRRLKDAFQCFGAALQRQADYGPALLNLAILYHHHLNNRPLALQTYRQYLGLNPSAPNALAVQDSIRQLHAELTPQPPREPTNLVSALPAVPAVAPARPATNTVAVSPATNASLTVTAPLPPERTPDVGARDLPHGQSNLVQTLPEPVRPLPQQQKETTAPPPAPPAKTDVVKIPEEPPLRVAQDSGAPPSAPSDAQSPLSHSQDGQPPPAQYRSTTDPAGRITPTADKRLVQDRVNPASWFRGRDKVPPTPTPLPPAAAVPQPVSYPAVAPNELPAIPQPPASTPRYKYRSLSAPPPGDRAKAGPFFAEGAQAHRDRRLAYAMKASQQASRLDPAFFEAHYNLGLAAYELKQPAESLYAYETALSIKPTSEDARYNFALALQMAGFFQDAAGEVEKLLAQKPSEARGHFLLASLYAESLKRPELARVHYRKVLELEPQHPQAMAIRFWLAANY
jgi:tetratricopeptide (TPR) repeat protein